MNFGQPVPEVDARKAVYTRVDDYMSRIVGDEDSVIVADPSGFAVDDTVLFFQTIGATPVTGGSDDEYFYTGKYGIMKIQEIDGNIIVFNSTLPSMAVNSRKDGEIAQLVKIPVYRDARLTDKFANDSAYWKWDPATKTGGVFPLIVGNLTLETNFSANAQGFTGGVPDGEYEGVCSEGDVIYNTEGMFTDAADSAGRKGESYDKEGYPFTKGFENVGSGGGGGNGKYSGGGGGANSGYGAHGGFESENCITAQDIGGKGGKAFPYNNNPGGFYYNRIVLGGGGGTGTQNPALNRFATAGGDGGGIIILLADTVYGQGYSITANGASVEELASAGAGGGGGGGVVVIDAGFINNVTFEAKGGNGGNVSTDFEKTGPGGAGGGGVVWYNNDLLFPGIINISAGKSGTVNGDKYGADGEAAIGARIADLRLPIRGFIINPLPDDQNICENEVPEKFQAAKPKGGTGTYDYQWLKSEFVSPDSFKVISGATSMTFQYPDPLTKTTYFKRRVTSGTVSDETFYITVFVTPAINNNLISSNDTICAGLTPGELTGTDEPVLSGGLGAGSYTFQWQSREDNNDWNNIGGALSVDYSPGSLNDTTYYRRVVQSGVCVDPSDSVEIIVLPAIEGNQLTTPQTVYCNNQEIQPITSETIEGGDGSYTYKWESKTGSGPWSDDLTSPDYSGVILTSDATESQTYQFRRTVFSGPGNTCLDISSPLSLTVLPDITSNSISVTQDTICSNLPAVTIQGSQPEGGDGTPYTYKWERSPDGTGSWTVGAGTTDQSLYQPGILSSTTYFRRIVTDGVGDVCSSISNVQKITVLPPITNNTISDDQDQCVNETPDVLEGTNPVGGDGEYNFLWQEKINEEGVWTNLDEIQKDYAPTVPGVGGQYNYRRIVFSGENNTCKDTSSERTIHVEDAIVDNRPTLLLIEACFSTEATIAAEPALGGDGLTPVYTWQDSIDGGNWGNAPFNFRAEDYVNPSLNQRIWYRRKAESQSGLCNTTSDIVMADTLTLPVLLGLSASADTICDDEPFTLYLDFESNYYGPFTVEYTNGKEIMTEDSVNDSIYYSRYDRPFEAFDFAVLNVEDANGCLVNGNFNDVISLWVNDAPSPAIIKPSEVFSICGPAFQLESDPDTNPGVSSGWWDTGADSELDITDRNAATGEFRKSLPFDSYSDTVFFKQETKNCGMRADTLRINMYEQPEEPVIYRGEETVLFIIDYDTLTGSTPTAGNFEWTLASEGASLEDPYANPVLVQNIPLENRTILRYTVSNGVCNSVMDEIRIDRREVNVFDGISPENQDGLNDFLVAEGLDVEGAVFTFQLFSTSGMLVREINTADIEELGFTSGLANNGLELWDGRDRNGNNFVPAGTYYYVLTIDYKNAEFVDKGFVLVR